MNTATTAPRTETAYAEAFERLGRRLEAARTRWRATRTAQAHRTFTAIQDEIARLRATYRRDRLQTVQANDVPARHQARIAAQDARMPEAIRAVMSRPAPRDTAPIARDDRPFSIWR